MSYDEIMHQLNYWDARLASAVMADDPDEFLSALEEINRLHSASKQGNVVILSEYKRHLKC